MVIGLICIYELNKVCSLLQRKGNGNVSRSLKSFFCTPMSGGVCGGEGSSTGGDEDERKAGGRIRKDVLAMVAQSFCIVLILH